MIQSGVTVTQTIGKTSSIEGLYWFEYKVKPLGASHKAQSEREVQLHSFLAYMDVLSIKIIRVPCSKLIHNSYSNNRMTMMTVVL
jgi:hypothetical protein